MPILDLTYQQESDHTYWVNSRGEIRSVVSGSTPTTEAALDSELTHACWDWTGRRLLFRTKTTVELWGFENGRTVLDSNCREAPVGKCLCFHPNEGVVFTVSGRRAKYVRGLKTTVFESAAEIVELSLSSGGKYLCLQTESECETFNIVTGEALGEMAPTCGAHLLWGTLFFSQVENPRGVGLMVVDLRLQEMVQGGPSGFDVFEELHVDSSGTWLIGVSPSQALVVGWHLEDSRFPVLRWEYRAEHLTHALSLESGDILLLRTGGKCEFLDQFGTPIKSIPMSWKGESPRMLSAGTLGSVSGESVCRWSLSNGEGVTYR